jgi:hypothetical protein
LSATTLSPCANPKQAPVADRLLPPAAAQLNKLFRRSTKETHSTETKSASRESVMPTSRMNN